MRLAYSTGCSGIEAPSVAWEPLGWEPQWFAQFDPEHNYANGLDFPSAVLAHRYPNVPNLFDMLNLPNLIRTGAVDAPDVFIAGTPCQSFSVAGLRKGLSDERGNVTLAYIQVLNEIDKRRDSDKGCIGWWENVPGVLSSKDNAFGCLLGGLVGEEKPLVPPGKRWSNAGIVLGPQRSAAWRILDAQYFGLAQRRKRVFVVASSRAGFDPASVLFEFDGMRRDTPPSRETGQSTAADAGAGAKTTGSHGEVVGALCARDYKGVGNQFVGKGKLMIAQPYEPVAKCLNAGGMSRQDYETESFVCHAIQGSMIGRSDKSGPQGNGVNDEVSFTLNTTDRHAVSYGLTTEQTPKFNKECALTLTKQSPTGGGQPQCVAIHGTQDPIVGDNRAHAVGRNNGGENCVYSFAPAEVGPTMGASGPPYSRPGNERVETEALAITQAAVRRLTPVECARLQGFPDNHTEIPWRGKPAEQCPDGPQYKAYGNSMATHVIRWLGQRTEKGIK